VAPNFRALEETEKKFCIDIALQRTSTVARYIICFAVFEAFSQQGLNTGLYLSDFHWGAEFRLATSDYSGHGGCHIGTVE